MEKFSDMSELLKPIFESVFDDYTVSAKELNNNQLLMSLQKSTDSSLQLVTINLKQDGLKYRLPMMFH